MYFKDFFLSKNQKFFLSERLFFEIWKQVPTILVK